MYAPICGTDGITYSNECHIKCAQNQRQDLKPKHIGECDGELENENENVCICPMNYTPLCGSDGHTYANECGFNCEKKLIKKPLEIVHAGECNLRIQHLPLEADISCLCEYVYDPVCGSDRNTYDNDCQLQCMTRTDASIRIAHRGEC